jgi:hypothetical protein
MIADTNFVILRFHGPDSIWFDCAHVVPARRQFSRRLEFVFDIRTLLVAHQNHGMIPYGDMAMSAGIRIP